MSDGHLDRLLEELGARANAELEEVRRDAAARADAVLGAAASRIEAKTVAAIAECDAQCVRHRAGVLATRRRESRAARLRAQHALVERVLARAKELTVRRLASAGDAAFARRSAALVAFAFGGATVARRADGMRLEADEGRLTIDDSVDAWLARRRERIAIDVCRAVERGLDG